MYIKIGDTQYPCDGYNPVPGVRAQFAGVIGLTLPVAGTVTLCADDGFELAQQDAGDYTRQTYESSVLTLTNEPEPEIPPEQEEPPSDPIADLSEMAVDHEYRITLLELGV
jgi:hypothetical protein